MWPYVRLLGKGIVMLKMVVAAGIAGLIAMPAAAVTITSVAGAPDPGKFAGEELVVTFDAANSAGVTDSSIGNVITALGSAPSVRAAPAGDTTIYRSIGGGGSSTFDFGGLTGVRGLRTISLYWGSVDNYNFVDFLDAAGNLVSSFSGLDLPAASGNQALPLTNRRVQFDLGLNDKVTQMRLRSTSAAFEFDDIAVRSVVPEPQSWALMIVGFGLVGAAARRRGNFRQTAA